MLPLSCEESTRAIRTADCHCNRFQKVLVAAENLMQYGKQTKSDIAVMIPSRQVKLVLFILIRKLD